MVILPSTDGRLTRGPLDAASERDARMQQVLRGAFVAVFRDRALAKRGERLARTRRKPSRQFAVMAPVPSQVRTPRQRKLGVYSMTRNVWIRHSQMLGTGGSTE